MSKRTGLLITNTGTPDQPTSGAVRRYLREFLSDPRVVKIPRLIWLPLLYFIILPLRAPKSAKLYQKIWTKAGSPMRYLMQQLTEKLQQETKLSIKVGMNYGNPSIEQALNEFQADGVDELIVLPLFPQYSNTTTASSFDRIYRALKNWKALPDIRFIRDYATHPAYIKALAASVRTFWKQNHPAQHLLISFHGLPKRFTEAGDPYALQCEQTAKLLAEALDLTADRWTLCYQSQFGYDKWLQPSTQALLLELPQRGIHSLDVVCPGFSIDCLETLEEIAVRGKEDFIAAGGKQLQLIPALNDSDLHINALSKITSVKPDYGFHFL